MSGSDHEVERIFRGLLELGDEVECDSYLGRECGGDGSLRRRVEALVRAHQSCGDFLEFDVGGAIRWR